MSDDNKTPNTEGITFERVLEILEKGDVCEEHGTIRWSSNYTFLVSLMYKETEVAAVYKPQRGERPLWDFPDGTLCYRERASFLTSEILGWKVVPPTVLRDGPSGLGSIQFYVHHDPQVNYFSFDDSALPQLLKLSMFDYLVNNADRKGGHCLLDSQGHIWGIDHGLTFNNVHKLRTVIWNFADKPVPQDLLDDIQKLCERLDNKDDDYRQKMAKLINESEMVAFHRRVRRILETRKYPEPGPGPNYPWPPV